MNDFVQHFENPFEDLFKPAEPAVALQRFVEFQIFKLPAVRLRRIVNSQIGFVARPEVNVIRVGHIGTGKRLARKKSLRVRIVADFRARRIIRFARHRLRFFGNEKFFEIFSGNACPYVIAFIRFKLFRTDLYVFFFVAVERDKHARIVAVHARVIVRPDLRRRADRVSGVVRVE